MSNRIQGKFIVFEGGEGSGKTTQTKLLVSQLESLGITAVYLREPGGIRISEDIRNIILDKQNTNMSPITELLLFLASRRQLFVEAILPALTKGHWVICDRFGDSSVVYQGHCRGLGMSTVKKLNSFVTGGFKPDLSLFLDVDVKLGLERAGKRGDMNRLDLEEISFHEKVREGYIALCKNPYDDSNVLPFNEGLTKDFSGVFSNDSIGDLYRIDANGSTEEVFEKIIKEVNKLL